MRRQRIVFPALLSIMFLFATAATAALQEARPSGRTSRWSFEFYGGLSSLHPADLNKMADYEESYFNFYHIQYNKYLSNVYGSSYEILGIDHYGDEHFAPIKGAAATGFRVRYALDEALSFSFGVQYLGRTETSDVGLEVRFQNEGRDKMDYYKSFIMRYRSLGSRLTASAWIPQAGIHLGIALGGRWRAETFFALGILIARCQGVFDYQIHSDVTLPGSYESDYSYRYNIIGKSKNWALAFEFGGRVSCAVARFLDFFIEVSRAVRDAGEVSGPGSSRSMFRDSNSHQDEFVQNWSGTWRVYNLDYQSAWGDFNSRYPVNYPGASASALTSPFRLNLSGYQIKLGLAVGLF